MEIRCPACDVILAFDLKARPKKVRCGNCRELLAVRCVKKKVTLTLLDENSDAVEPPLDPRACRKCGCPQSYVQSTRPQSTSRIVRYRQCRNCGHRFTTVEVVPGQIKD